MEIKKDKGSNVIISEDVIAKIASVAAMDVEGVSSVVPKPVDIKRLFKNQGVPKAVYMTSTENQDIIDIYVSLKFGAKISEVAEKIQASVKEAVQNMTGKVVTKVNTHICEIDLTKSVENK